MQVDLERITVVKSILLMDAHYQRIVTTWIYLTLQWAVYKATEV